MTFAFGGLTYLCEDSTLFMDSLGTLSAGIEVSSIISFNLFEGSSRRATILAQLRKKEHLWSFCYSYFIVAFRRHVQNVLLLYYTRTNTIINGISLLMHLRYFYIGADLDLQKKHCNCARSTCRSAKKIK